MLSWDKAPRDRNKKRKASIGIRLIFVITITLRSSTIHPQAVQSASTDNSPWYLSFQYLGLTWHPGGGGNSEVYPLKCEKKGYLVPEVGVAANLDYRMSDSFFLRFTSALYKDCAFVYAGCVHAGPRVFFFKGRNRLNAGIGPIFSFR
jgi:hypothetical protein